MMMGQIWKDRETLEFVQEILVFSGLTLNEALERKFFLGHVEFVGFQQIVHIDPAMVLEKMIQRKESDTFCMKCLNPKDNHDLECKYGPWAIL